jgi:subtilisin family serine protease
MNGKRMELEQHPTDFSVLAPAEQLARAIEAPETARYEEIKNKVKAEAPVQPLSAGIARMQAKDAKSRDEVMDEVRRESVAHHIYRVAGTGEEIAIDNRIFLTPRNEDPELLERIIEEFHLVPEGRMADAYILRVTEATGRNPLKTANAIAEREGVLSCTPQVLVPLQPCQMSLFDSHRLFRHQWYLSSDLVSSPDLDPTAGINAPEAWQLTTGSPDIVVAVIDDGFDLSHPAFRNKRIHPARRDFAVKQQDNDPSSEQTDFHGTCVASIATGSFEGDGMIGVAPGCTFLPIRIGFGPMAAQVDMLEVFRYVSRFADVVNCSFGTPPLSFDVFAPQFRNALTQLTRTGGRRGKGLVIVFAAGNDDAPTLLPAARNVNGVKYVDLNAGRIREVPAGSEVFSGYPLTRGVVVVGAMSSLKRKTGYSNWGPHLTVAAPSNNMHYITRFIRQGGADEASRARFVANYRGLGQVAAVNRLGKGRPFEPLRDKADTPDFNESLYTMTFGGTSGAAPVVTGVAALMLSVNPHLTASQVRQILMSTADRNLDPTLDLAADPNLQGVRGSFAGGNSPFFGAGKVNALRAVERARALLLPLPAPVPTALMLTQPAAPSPLKGNCLDLIRAGEIVLAAAGGDREIDEKLGDFTNEFQRMVFQQDVFDRVRNRGCLIEIGKIPNGEDDTLQDVQLAIQAEASRPQPNA